MGIPKPSVEDILRDVAAERAVCVSAVAELPTRFGHFQVVAFHAPDESKEHAALVHGDITGKEDVPVRLHSECLTGDAFTSFRCDCRQQLELAMEKVQEMPAGAILYLRQEGRGIGFANKIRAYQLQEMGLDTNEANERLGFQADERDYEVAAQMLRALGVKSVRLMSNNPDKARDLEHHGIKVTGRIEVVVPPTPHNAFYLETKRVKSGHLLPEVPKSVLSEQLDCMHRTSNKQRRGEPAAV
ncbi:MAG: cyclohydrolase [Thermoplasmata archaeon]|jgi:GTP cyclohydrolase II|nr:cyclohydrolase [Thermoplasmata archaeon]